MSLESQANRCFVCGPGNPIGLNVRFRMEQEKCLAEFTPANEHVGYDKLTHGGILFCLLDDVMANWIWLQGEQCFTAKAAVRYRSTLPVGTAVHVEGWCRQRRGRLAVMAGRVVRQDTGEVVAEGSARFMITGPRDEAR